jgi:exonuclease VII small subunit
MHQARFILEHTLSKSKRSLTMSTPSLEQRVATLEREIVELKRAGKSWRRTIGMFTDNPEMLNLFEQAMKLRESDRAKARRTASHRGRSKA